MTIPYSLSSVLLCLMDVIHIYVDISYYRLTGVLFFTLYLPRIKECLLQLWCKLLLSMCLNVPLFLLLLALIYRFMSPCCLSNLLHCLPTTVFCTCINNIVRVSVISLFITASVHLASCLSGEIMLSHGLLCSIFSCLLIWVIYVTAYWLFAACLFLGAGHVLLFLSICFVIVCLKLHKFFVVLWA